MAVNASGATGVAIALGWLSALVMYPALPAPASTGSLPPVLARLLVALCLPTAATVTHLILRRLWGESAFEKTSEAVHRTMALHVVLFILMLHLLVLLSLAGVESVHGAEPRLVILLFGAVFIAAGNLLPRTRPNPAFGIRTARTLTDRQLWVTLHRTCGYIAVAFGAVVLIAGLFLRDPTLGQLIGAAAVSAAAALMWAQVRYRRKWKADSAAVSTRAADWPRLLPPPVGPGMLPDRPRGPWGFTTAFVVFGLVTLATIEAVGSSIWFNRPARDDSSFTGYAHCRLSRLAFSPDGRFIATAGTDYTVRIWDARTGLEARILRGHTDHRVLSVAFSPDGTWLASGGRDRTVRIWDPTVGGPLRTIAAHRDRVMALAVSPDGSAMATGSRDHSIKIWDARTFRERARLGGASEGFGFVRSVAFHAGSRLVAFGDWFGAVRLWNLETGDVRVLGHFGRAIYDLAFSPDGRFLASAGHDARVRLFDVATASQQQVFEGHTGAVIAVAFSPRGHLLASGSDDRTIRLWDVETGLTERTLLGHAKGLTSIAFSPDGGYLASTSADETFKFWRLQP